MGESKASHRRRGRAGHHARDPGPAPRASRSRTWSGSPRPRAPASATSAWSGSAAARQAPSWPSRCAPASCGSRSRPTLPGTGFRSAGSLTIATTEAELAVLREAAKLPDAKPRGLRAARRRRRVREVNPALRGDFLGGLWCRADAVAEPRLALPALGASLAARAAPATNGCPGARPSSRPTTRSATSTASGTTVTSSCCAPGPASPAWPDRTWPRRGALASAPAAGAGLRRVRLQMLQTAPLARTADHRGG